MITRWGKHKKGHELLKNMCNGEIENVAGKITP